jgi:hypothetical protein
MTEPEDHSSTRPISVAELLAKNGSIGSPPVGGRRRRRRGNSDSVTVAELTGEIPIISDAGQDADYDYDDAPDPPESHDEPAQPVRNGGYAHARPHGTRRSEYDEDDHTDEHPAFDGASTTTPTVALTEAEADYEAHLEQRDAEDEPVEFTAPPRRPQVPSPPGFSSALGGAEQMSPDPFADDVDDEDHADLIDSLEFEAPLEAARNGSDDQATQVAFEVPSYLRSNPDTLFGGGQTVADDLARRGRQPTPEDIDLGADDRHSDDDDDFEPDQPQGSAFLRGVWVVAQCILAVAFGAGLFIAFDLLWKWNNIVALVLSVLVILGLVIGVRVVRKTEDLGSTAIAVAVGALVTLGPLALLQSH